MPRRRVPKSRRAGGPPGDLPSWLGSQVESRRDGDWHVRRLSGATTHKSYTCPGCHHAVHPGTAHVVVWPVEAALLSSSAIDERRHWHTPCWERRL